MIYIKGIGHLVAAVLLIIMAISASFIVFRWGVETTKSYQNETESQVQENVKKKGANFYIKEMNGKNLTILNNGKVELPVKSFTFYLNDRKMKAEPYTDKDMLKVGEELKFKMKGI